MAKRMRLTLAQLLTVPAAALAGADLGVGILPSKPALAGGLGSFEVTARNAGPDPSLDVVLTCQLSGDYVDPTANASQGSCQVSFAKIVLQDWTMGQRHASPGSQCPLALALWGALRAALRTRTDLALENLALRQQLALLRRRSKRPRFGRVDRAFWLWLSNRWSG